MGLRVVHERCAGVDVHKRVNVVCVQVPGQCELREFGTDTASLLQLADWLQQWHIDDVAMEATGSYWKPVYNVLEASGLRPVVCNPAHLKAVPGRKTDAKDAEWLCDLFRHGLIKPSFIPPRVQRELRELARYRISLVQERAAEANRIAKVLEGGNIKLASVVTDILGVSSRLILAAMVQGEDDPEVLASMARGSLADKHDQLAAALRGRMSAHQREMLRMQLRHVEFLDQQIAALDAEVADRLRPHDQEIKRLDVIPGINQRAAEVIVAVIGVDMSQFPSADHLVSWAGMCPGSNQSGGKRRNARARKGNQMLRRTLVQAGHAAGRSKGTYLGATYRRISTRRGGKRAAMAVGRHILQAAYYMLRDGVDYHELGSNHYEQQRKEVIARSAVKRLQRLGYKVTIEAA